jgi:hypothetical protein
MYLSQIQGRFTGFKLGKTTVKGPVEIQNADVNYVPRKINFTNTNILNFTGS